MSTDVKPDADSQTVPEAPATAGRVIGVSILRLVAALIIPIVAFFLLWVTFDFLRNSEANRVLVVLVAIVVGVGGVFFLFWAMNRVIEWLPARYREGVRPYVFVGPCLVILSVFLIYPVINTILLSFNRGRNGVFEVS